jgi:hypothetical protein
MLETMTIRCDQCGHENNPLYRFCGMCGAPLAASAPAVQSRPMPSFTPAARPLPRNDPPRPARPAPPPQESWPVSGPSFLGLADEPASPSRNVDYLLEDDDRPRRTYGRAISILLILAGFAAFLYYQWRGDGGSLSRLWSRVTPQTAAPAAQPTPPPAAPESSPEVAGQPHSATVTEDAQSAGNTASPASPSAATPAPSPAPAAETPKAENTQLQSAADNQEQQAEAAPAEKPAAAKPAPHPPRKAAPVAAASAPEPSVQDSLAVEGERYLYGNGVPENCDRAQRSLTRAAQGGSAKAYTLLGAMYATGHCATRDLPTSYRWFARALHQDPANTRLEKNLEVIWRQMTPEERQLATRQ